MAKNTVEFISSQLGGGIINNAASQATLAELLNAVKVLEKNIEGSDTSADETSIADTFIPSSKQISRSMKLLVRGLGNFAGAGKTFFTMVARGDDKISQYGDFLNTQVIAKLPLFGEALSGLGSVLVTSIEIFESWNTDLRTASSYGASFTNSIIVFRETANKMMLAPEELINLVKGNSEKFISMGGTVSNGLNRFSNLTEDLFVNNQDIVTELDRMGYSAYEQAELLLEFADTTRRGRYYQTGEQIQTGKLFLAYAKEMDLYQKLTGQDKQARNDALAVANQDAVFRMKTARYSDKTQANIQTALAGFSAIYGKQGVELLKSIELNVKPQTDSAILLMSNLPGLDRAMKEALDMAKKGGDPALFQQYLDEVIAKQLEATKDQIKTLDPILRAAAVGDVKAKETLSALNPVIDFIARRGGTNKNMADAYRESIKSIRDEQRRTDPFTGTLRLFQRAVMNLKYVFVKDILYLVEHVGREFQLGQIGPKMTEFNLLLQKLWTDALPYAKGFFQMLNDEHGQEILKSTFFSMMRYLKYSLQIFISNLVKDLGGETVQKVLTYFGMIGDVDALRAAQEAETSNIKGTIDLMGGGEKKPIAQPMTFDEKGNQYALSNLARGQFGEFQTWSGGSVGFGSLKGITDSSAISRVLEERESRAKQGLGVEGNEPDNYGGLTLLQREYLYNKLGTTPLKHALFNPYEYARLRDVTKEKLKKMLSSEEALAEMQSMRDKFPNTYAGMRTGTLGTMGKLFADFGKGTPVTLHGNEAVVTPKQLGDIVNSSSQISVTDVINRLNSNVNRLIQTTKDEILIEKSKLMALEAQMP